MDWGKINTCGRVQPQPDGQRKGGFWNRMNMPFKERTFEATPKVVETSSKLLLANGTSSVQSQQKRIFRVHSPKRYGKAPKEKPVAHATSRKSNFDRWCLREHQ